MGARDPHRFVNELDDATIERLIARLESRAKDVVFSRLFDKYVTKLKLPASAHVLEIGCGTGAVLRALAPAGLLGQSGRCRPESGFHRRGAPLRAGGACQQQTRIPHWRRSSAAI